MGLFDFLKSGREKTAIDLTDFKFISNDHIRYQNGKDVSGHNYDCGRGIRIQTNISGGQGYTVTMYNLDGNHPVWGNNIQMAPKQMKIIKQTANQILLRGYGNDQMGNSFEDYGITLNIKDGKVGNVKLHLFDKNVEIMYYKDADVVRSSTNLEILFSLSEKIINSSDNKSILNNANELKNLILNNKKIFEIEVSKELYDAMEKSYKALLKSIDLTTNKDERYELVKAVFFVFSKYRIVSPGNGNVCECKIRLLINYKAELIELFKSLDAKINAPDNSNTAIVLMLYYLLNDNKFVLDYNPDLKSKYEELKGTIGTIPNSLNLGKSTEEKYNTLSLN